MTVLTFPGGFDLSKPWLFEIEGAAPAALFLAQCLDLGKDCAAAVIRSAADNGISESVFAELKDIWRGKLRDDLGRLFDTAKVDDQRVVRGVYLLVVEAFDEVIESGVPA